MARQSTAIRLAFSTNAFVRHTLDDAVRAIAEAGYEGVEVLADVPHAWPPGFSDAQCDQLASLLRECGLAVSNVNANCSFGYYADPPAEPFFEPSLISPRDDHRRDRLALIERTLQIAHRIGAGNISITSGRLLPTVPPERACTLLRENLARVLDAAHRTGVRVGIECEPGLFIERAVELRQLIDDIGSPLLGANLDVGHCFVIGESIPAAIRTLAGRIWNVHVEDIRRFGPAGLPKHYHLPPGQGDMELRSVGEALCAVGYDGFATVELYTCPDAPREAACQSAAYLRGIWSKAGGAG